MEDEKIVAVKVGDYVDLGNGKTLVSKHSYLFKVIIDNLEGIKFETNLVQRAIEAINNKK